MCLHVPGCIATFWRPPSGLLRSTQASCWVLIKSSNIYTLFFIYFIYIYFCMALVLLVWHLLHLIVVHQAVMGSLLPPEAVQGATRSLLLKLWVREATQRWNLCFLGCDFKQHFDKPTYSYHWPKLQQLYRFYLLLNSLMYCVTMHNILYNRCVSFKIGLWKSSCRCVSKHYSRVKSRAFPSE